MNEEKGILDWENLGYSSEENLWIYRSVLREGCEFKISCIMDSEPSYQLDVIVDGDLGIVIAIGSNSMAHIKNAAESIAELINHLS